MYSVLKNGPNIFHTQNAVFHTRFFQMKMYKADIIIILFLHISYGRKEDERFMRIAVCDDDRATREHIVSPVKEQIQGAEVMTFGSGKEMLKVQEDFDISFLDVEMKELSGIDVTKHIRNESIARRPINNCQSNR